MNKIVTDNVATIGVVAPRVNRADVSAFQRDVVNLVELDQMIRQYPTDPKLYEMKGTLLDRLGYRELALKAWDESLELDPANGSLKKFMQRREAKRTISGETP